MRLIDADALMLDIRKHSESYFADDFAHEWVDRQPTADAEPVRHGRWERKYVRPAVYADLCWHCSVCEAKYPDSYWADKFAYCPSCGAKMDKEDTDERD